MMPALYTVLLLVVSVGAGAAATWILIRIDRMTPGRRLGRRALMVLSAMAAGAEAFAGPRGSTVWRQHAPPTAAGCLTEGQPVPLDHAVQFSRGASAVPLLTQGPLSREAAAP